LYLFFYYFRKVLILVVLVIPMNPRVGIAVAVLLALLLGAVSLVLIKSSEQPAGERIVTDMAGKEIKIPAKLERVVTLNSEALEMFYLFGEAEKVVGVGSWSKLDPILPKIMKLENLPDVGTASNPNVEAIVSLKPDLVITYYAAGRYGYETPKEIVDKLEQAGIPVFGIILAVTKPADFNQYYEMVDNFGKLLGKEKRAKEINDYLRGIRDRVVRETSKIPEENRIKVVYSWGDMTRIAGNATTMHAFIQLAGGINIGGELPQPYPTVDAEFIVSKNPNVWVCWHSKTRKYSVSDILKDPRFQSVSAVRDNRVYEEPELGSNWHPVRAHLFLLWHAKTYYPSLPLDFQKIANEVCQRFYGIPLPSG